jgi:hypothetical protein
MDDQDDLLKEKLYYKNPEPTEADDFLDIIRQIESSDGLNTEHPTMKSGIHAGHSGIGSYGLMPNTIKELNNRAKRAGGLSNEHMRDLDKVQDPAIVKQTIEQQPELEKIYARQLAEKVLGRFPDQEQAAYSWNQGHNITPEAMAKRDYRNSDYVKKFNKLRQRLIGSK